MTHNKSSKPIRITPEEEIVLAEVQRLTRISGFARLMLNDFSGATIRTLVDRGLLFCGRNSDTYADQPRHEWVHTFQKNGGGYVRLSKRAANRPWIII